MPVDPHLPTFESSITTLAAGEEEMKYEVHEALLPERSQFFASATKEVWKEGREHRVPFSDDAPSVVDLYVQRKCSERIICLRGPAEEREEDKRSKNAHEFELQISGFVFGEKVQDNDFKDAIIDALVHTVATQDEVGTRWDQTGKRTSQADSGTPEGPPICRLPVDLYVFHGGLSFIHPDLTLTPCAILMADRALIQERYAPDQFRALVTCLFLNKTRGEVAGPYITSFFEKYPTAESVRDAEPLDVLQHYF
ncbi:hypothetical protein KC353_g306 [Hortaea werneckii]|nr:hypothetical protein KC353_g306 [Hortaea werneckii]